MIDRRRILAAASAALAAAAAGPAGARAPRRSSPHDLTGTWTNAWYTHLQRPKGFKTLVATPAEAEAFEAPRRRLHGELANEKDVLGQNESEFPDQGPGLARIRGEIRSSWIVDPPDGRIPWTAAARVRLGIDKPLPENFDNVEARDVNERCLIDAGAGAPIINSHDGNLIEIVQTPGWVVIVGEKDHGIRIVDLTGTAPGPSIGGWLGVSIGHWEGATLVVETTGLRPGLTKISDELKLSDQARVVERFTRTGPGEISYLFEVTDPSLFTQTWRGEMIFRPAEGRMFEYACHEGNYSLPGILAAARQGNQGDDKPAK